MTTRNGIILTTLLLLLIALASGCDQDQILPPNGNNNGPPDYDYGPPFGEIAFYDTGWILATAFLDSDTIRYVRGTGSEGAVSAPGFLPVWVPSTVEDSVRFLLYDTGAEALDLVSESGYARTIGEQVAHNAFAVSRGGSRVIYIQDNQDDTLRLIREDLIGLNEQDEVFRIPSGYYQQGPLSFALGAGFGLYASLLNLHHANQPEVSNFFILDNQGEYILEPQFINAVMVMPDPADDNTSDIAYLLDDGSGTAQTLVVRTMQGDTLGTERTLDLSTFGGATAFSWSPQGDKIALFAGAAIGEPLLLVTDNIFSEVITATELSLDEAIIIPEPDNPDLLFAAPDWSPSGDRVVVLVRNSVTERNDVLAVNVATGEVQVIVDIIDPTLVFQPTWRKPTGE